jgi:hypothetical protein
LPVLKLDNFIRTYAPFDIEAGSVDVVTELAARDGMLQGYVKPIVYNLDVFSWKEDIKEDGDNPLRALWEGLVDLVAEILENQPRDQIASNIPLEGDISAPDTNVFVAVANIFKNAFVEAYQANLENTISLFTGDDEDDITAVDLPPPLSDEELIDDKDVEQREAVALGTSASENDAEAAEQKEESVEAQRSEGDKSDEARDEEVAARDEGDDDQRGVTSDDRNDARNVSDDDSDSDDRDDKETVLAGKESDDEDAESSANQR